MYTVKERVKAQEKVFLFLREMTKEQLLFTVESILA